MSTTPETLTASPAEKTNGLATYLKVLYAPGDAFSTLARVPTWGWAALIAIVISTAGVILVMPATIHYAGIAQQQQLSQMPAERAAAARDAMAKIPTWALSLGAIIGGVFGPWFYWLLAAIVFLIGAALGGGDARFKSAWVVAVNLYAIALVGGIISWITIALRGADSVNTISDLYVLPSPAMLVHGSAKLATFLYAFNIVNIWLYIASIFALERVLKMRRAAAIATVLALILLSAGMGAMFAK